MSHFSQIKTQIRNLSGLQSALTDLGLTWKSGSTLVQGYQGLATQAEIVIEQSNGYDIGFAWNGQEYTLVTDMQFWQQSSPVELFLQRITQRYAYHTILQAGSEQGFQVAEQQKIQDGSIRLVLQRWSA